MNALMKSLVACVMVVAISPASHAEDEDPREVVGKIMKDWVANRQAIQYMELKWSVHTVLNDRYPQVNGCQERYHGWYDFHSPRIRVDLDSACPNDASIERSTRLAFAGSRCLIVLGDNVIGYEVSNVGEDYLDLNNMSSIAAHAPYTDVRIAGLLAQSFTLLKNYTFDDVLEVYSTARGFDLIPLPSGGQQFKLRGVSGVDCEVTYVLSDRSGMPVKIFSEAHPRSGSWRNQVECEWKWYPHATEPESGVWLPLAMRSKTWDKSKLVNEEELHIESAVLGVPPPKGLFEWSSMRLPDKFVVERRDGNREQMVQWEAAASRFVEWKPVILAAHEAEMDVFEDGVNPTRRTLLILNAIVVAVLLTWIVGSRVNRARRSQRASL